MSKPLVIQSKPHEGRSPDVSSPLSLLFHCFVLNGEVDSRVAIKYKSNFEVYSPDYRGRIFDYLLTIIIQKGQRQI